MLTTVAKNLPPEIISASFIVRIAILSSSLQVESISLRSDIH